MNPQPSSARQGQLADDDTQRLLIVGASARAAAQAAVRAGYAAWSADLFADVDLQATGESVKVDRYPAGLLTALNAAPAGSWLYTGALENYPHLIARLSRLRPLLGNPTEVLQQVRRPELLSSVLAAVNFRYPRLLAADEADATAASQDASQQWLHKPIRSGGGTRVRWWNAATMQQVSAERAVSRRRGYLQQYVHGRSGSAAFLAAERKAVLLGFTWQRCGEQRLGASGFTYCGSTGPIRLQPAVRAELERLGAVLAETFELRGLFGVDLVMDSLADAADTTGTAPPFTVLEINPRYTASMELLERVYGWPLVRWHVAACAAGSLPTLAELNSFASPERAAVCHTKGILFAARDGVFHAGVTDYVRECNAATDWPLVADIPAIGASLPAGAPIATLFAAGADEKEADAQLHQRVAQFRRLLDGAE